MGGARNRMFIDNDLKEHVKGEESIPNIQCLTEKNI